MARAMSILSFIKIGTLYLSHISLDFAAISRNWEELEWDAMAYNLTDFGCFRVFFAYLDDGDTSNERLNLSSIQSPKWGKYGGLTSSNECR